MGSFTRKRAALTAEDKTAIAHHDVVNPGGAYGGDKPVGLRAKVWPLASRIARIRVQGFFQISRSQFDELLFRFSG
jgi:hypothetical protein